jgi:putative nucleotidyltransferase with HDIG domain
MSVTETTLAPPAVPGLPAGPRRSESPSVKRSLSQALTALDRYPALAYGRGLLLAAACEPTPSTARMVITIEADVALTAHVLRAANARPGQYGKAAPVVGVPQAVELLGPDGVAEVATKVPEAGFFTRAGARISPARFGAHAVAVRAAAQRVMHTCRPAVDADLVYAAAMLHDIGKLVLALSDPDYELDRTTGTPAQRFAAECRTAGAIDHGTIGAALASRWGLPQEIAEAISQHHRPGASIVADVVGLADLLAHYGHGHDVSGSDFAPVCESLRVTRPQLEKLLFPLPGSGSAGTRALVERCPLTRREVAVLRSLGAGRTYKQIAAEHDISASTVRTHLHNIYHKLSVADRAQAVLLASDRGWL